MKVVILAGGYGTRIRDVSSDIPKPMIPIGPYPILWHIMKTYAHYGYKDFVICLGYKGQEIKDFFLNYEAYTRDFTIGLGGEGKFFFHSEHDESDWTVTLADTGVHSMTGSRVLKIKKYIGDDEEFLLTYGDGVSDVDITELVNFHHGHDKALTVTGVRPPGRFGEMVEGSAGDVTEFNEKPQVEAGRISGGFFVVNRKVFDYLHDDESLVFEESPIQHLVKDGEMMMFKHDGFWQPMDSSREHKLLNALYEDGDAPWVK